MLQGQCCRQLSCWKYGFHRNADWWILMVFWGSQTRLFQAKLLVQFRQEIVLVLMEHHRGWFVGLLSAAVTVEGRGRLSKFIFNHLLVGERNKKIPYILQSKNLSPVRYMNKKLTWNQNPYALWNLESTSSLALQEVQSFWRRIYRWNEGTPMFWLETPGHLWWSEWAFDWVKQSKVSVVSSE